MPTRGLFTSARRRHEEQHVALMEWMALAGVRALALLQVAVTIRRVALLSVVMGVSLDPGARPAAA